MAEVYLQSRLEFLLRVQNADGGWGYFPGKQSWMEPTVYSMLALHGLPEGRTAMDQAWQLVQSWQRPDGSWRAGAGVQDGTWVTALGLLLACSRGDQDGMHGKAVAWLMDTCGLESRWTVRLASYFHMLQTDVNVNHRGWPWRPGTSAWIEPTALTILALEKSLEQKRNPEVLSRVREGEQLILSRRAHDGGWNSGNPNVLKYDQPSYPETTALALLGLQARSRAELAGPLAVARQFYNDCRSSLAKAWLTLALRCHGELVATDTQVGHRVPDVLLCALQALGHPAGNYGVLKIGAIA